MLKIGQSAGISVMACPQRLPRGFLKGDGFRNMVIYSLRKDKEIYVGKTKDLRQRIYAHRASAVRELNRPLYRWINDIGFDNLTIETEMECPDDQADFYEKETIRKYEDLGYRVLNAQLTKTYCPTGNFENKFIRREEVWDLYTSTNLSRREITERFGISDSLLTKIIQENGGSNRKSKLCGHYEDIQKAIMEGTPIRELARKYSVAKTAIGNINMGITAYNPELTYPLNHDVRENNIRASQFKKKV